MPAEPRTTPRQVRDAEGKYVKGTPGGPGRPRGFGALIRHLTADGEELVLHALEIMRGERVTTVTRYTAEGAPYEIEALPTIAEQQAARCWLADRGFGKAVERIEVAPGVPEVHPATLTALEPTDARAFFALTRKLAGPVVDGVLVAPAGTAVAESPVSRRGDDPEPVDAGAEPAPAGPAGADPR